MEVFESDFRYRIRESLPDISSLFGMQPELRNVYLPAAHVKALRPDSLLVVGMRGSGKSFWWAALQDSRLREAFGERFGLSGTTIVSTGFGEHVDPNVSPGKDVLLGLLSKGLDPRRIWQTVIIHNVGRDHLPLAYTTLDRWEARVQWVVANPELVENVLYRTDETLTGEGVYHLVLFDALDRTADDWTSMNYLVRGLLQVALDFRSFRRIRLKVFVRPDQLSAPTIATFPDSSKVLSQQIHLSWPRSELYGLFWQYLANGETSGTEFRVFTGRVGVRNWEETNAIWPIPDSLRSDEKVQRTVFHAITGPWMGKDRRRGSPYTWLPNHLGDARREVSPRSFLAALKHAVDDASRPEHVYALHYESIKHGVREASHIRVREIKEDYAWVPKLLQSLSGLTVPCPVSMIDDVWQQQRLLETLEDSIKSENAPLLPVHLSEGTEGVIKDLVDLAILERLPDGRVNLPDVYRIGFGIGRRGGVKPVV